MIVPTIIASQSYAITSAKSSFIAGYNIDAPNIIGIESKKEYLAEVVRSEPVSKPVAIVSPEREKPGKAASP